MSLEVSAKLEEARLEEGLERDLMCMGAEVLIPVLWRIRPAVVEWGKSRIPGWIRWLLGGIVDDVVDGVIEGLESWKVEQCENGSETP